MYVKNSTLLEKLFENKQLVLPAIEEIVSGSESFNR